MSKTQPIKDEEMLKKFRNYYRDIEPNPRNYALIVFGLNSALRISDILGLCWNDVYSDQNHRYREHIAVWEQKTGKENILIVNIIEKLFCIIIKMTISFRDKKAGRNL